MVLPLYTCTHCTAIHNIVTTWSVPSTTTTHTTLLHNNTDLPLVKLVVKMDFASDEDGFWACNQMIVLGCLRCPYYLLQ